MLRLFFFIAFVFISDLLSSQNSVRIELHDLPSYHDKSSSIYLAGSFNGWNPRDDNYKFSNGDGGNYTIEVKLKTGVYEFKLTRGGWDKVECTSTGADVLNRSLKVNADTTITISIQGWKDRFSSEVLKKRSTGGKNVIIIDTAFLIPQLNRHRRVWIYLPEDYKNSQKRYPVLYMHDGQNIFDDATSYSGEWGIDECIDTMKKRCIVVGIDNGGDKRLNEYCPYDFSLTGIAASNISGKGEGNEYTEFLVKTLKPYIDKHYRTLKDKEDTWIAGSSMGGLISMYAILKYPKVFGVAGVFSPAFWVGPEIFNDITKKGKKIKGKVYFYAGSDEGENMVPDMMKAFHEMTNVSRSTMTAIVRDGGKHNEQTWRKEFALFYNWVLEN
ncbi:MAG TPA: alpha/beta hydrolase-fold protein [Chitinophagaceae bacterium]|nr:alpha/beta hydrolase-fold protein [Chitinophagaceae bacterium]